MYFQPNKFLFILSPFFLRFGIIIIKKKCYLTMHLVGGENQSKPKLDSYQGQKSCMLYKLTS